MSIDSVIQQTFKNFELLIIDGVSTDNTIKIAQKYNDIRIRIWSEPDKGIYDAMNKGIMLAKGDWLYFLGCDDYFYNNEVLNNISNYLKNKRLDILYGNVIFSNSGIKYGGFFTAFKIIEQNISHQAIFTRKEVFQKLGYFDPKYVVVADWHFNLRWFSNRKIKRKYVDKIIAFYGEEGYSANTFDKKFDEDRSKIIKEVFPFHIRYLYENRNKALFRYYFVILRKVNNWLKMLHNGCKSHILI